MIVLDSTVLIDVLRDRTGRARRALEARLAGREIAFMRPIHFEVLRGCKDQRQWDRIARFLESHRTLEIAERTWEEAARTAFELRKRGKTIRSGIDCLIAQIAIEHDQLLLHNDRDFETIATMRPLKQERIDVKARR